MQDIDRSTEKIHRGFIIHKDIFQRFKAKVAKEGYSNYSEVIEQLILQYLKK
jgi:metal-responsive CopG/Arc/MetJ family transcriptional regulator